MLLYILSVVVVIFSAVTFYVAVSSSAKVSHDAETLTLTSSRVAALNPRRDEIISAIGETARQQITWEFDNLKSAKVILFWFPNAETVITFLELGKELARKSNIVVGVDPDYNRRFDIETQVHLELPRAVIYTTLDETVRAAAELCGEEL